VNADVGFDRAARKGLDEVFAEGGVEDAMLGVESLTAVSLAFGFESGAAAVASVLAPLGTLTVDLAADVEVPGWSAPLSGGRAALDAATAAAVLTESPSSSPGGFIGHRDNAVAVWQAVAEANGGGSRPAVAEPALPTGEQEFFDRFFAGPVGSRPIAAVPIDDSDGGDDNDGTSGVTTTTSVATESTSTTAPDSTSTSAGDDATSAAPVRDDLVQVDRADAIFVFASIAPGSMSGPAAGLLFRLEAPPGYDAEVKRTVEVLLYFGGNVVSIDSTIAPRPDTVFIVPDEVNRDEAEATNGIFGDFSFVEPQVRIDGVDLTVVLGTEYLDGVDA
jgi:hypothetical protein